MSEEKRFKNKKLIAVSIAFVLVCGLSGVLGFMLIFINNNYNDLSGDYDDLYIDHLELLNDFNRLDNQYFILTGEHIALKNDYNVLVVDLANMTSQRDILDSTLTAITAERDDLLIQVDILNDEISVHLTTIADLNSQIGVLEAEIIEMTGFRDALQSNLNILQLQYDTLLDDYQILFDANVDLQTTYDALLIAYDYICNTIKQSILPVQYSIFTEAVRRYYMDIYLEGLWELDEKEYWNKFAEFCRDIILHDSWQYNAFSGVSNAFSDALRFGNDTMYLADYIMYWTFYNWLPNWDEFALTGNELTDIDTVVQWCIDEIDYEYDSGITMGQEYFEWDYIKFPVETAFRTMGDCEDQAILASAYLESCGFETAIVISHDPAHPTLGAFYHGHLLVHIEDPSAYYVLYPSTPLWRLPYDPYEGYTWAWLDTTWNVPFGSNPSWLQDYIDDSIPLSSEILTLAYCDIGGSIYTNTGENAGLTCVMPT